MKKIRSALRMVFVRPFVWLGKKACKFFKIIHSLFSMTGEMKILREEVDNLKKELTRKTIEDAGAETRNMILRLDFIEVLSGKLRKKFLSEFSWGELLRHFNKIKRESMARCYIAMHLVNRSDVPIEILVKIYNESEGGVRRLMSCENLKQVFDERQQDLFKELSN